MPQDPSANRAAIPPSARSAEGSGPSAASQLTLGGGPLGNLFAPVSNEQASAVVATAWRLGIRSFDTAPHYGLGLSEIRLGEALAEHDRSEFTLSTKVGRVIEPVGDHLPDGQRDPYFEVAATHRRRWDFTERGITQSIEASMERLGIDYVDVAYLHDPDDHMESATTVGVAALQKLKEQGIIRAVGVGMNNVDPLLRFVRLGGIDQIMVAGRMTLLDRSAADVLLPECAARGVAVIAAGVFNSGVLAADDPNPSSTFDYRTVTADILERAQTIAALCAGHGVAMRAVALAFALRDTSVEHVCFGARRQQEVVQNVEALSHLIPLELWRDLAAAGFVEADRIPPTGVV